MTLGLQIQLCRFIISVILKIAITNTIISKTKQNSYLDELLKQIKNAEETKCEFTFHRGRYGMALDLQNKASTDTSLNFLAEYTLGQICHIVELAIQGVADRGVSIFQY